MNEIISARHVCERDRMRTLRQWYFMAMQRIASTEPHFTGRTSGEPVQAYINNGRWLATCNCNGCQGKEYVRVDEPIFYCLSCGNRSTNGDARPVTFPENWQAIEAALLKRPIVLGMAPTMIERVYASVPRGLPRNWAAPTTVEDLEAENREVGI